MNCPSCGRANDRESIECAHCQQMLVDAFAEGGAVEPTEGQEVTVSANEADDLLAAYKAAERPAPAGEKKRSGSTQEDLRGVGDPTTSPEQSPPTARDPMESTGFDIHQGHSPAQAYAPLLNTTGELPRLFQFGDRYQILETLGEGGMGRVYKALDLELDRPVALKTIRTEKTGPEALERFKQELILARKITHKNVIRIHDLGEFSGLKYFTMELVEGQSLGEVLKEKGKLTVAETIPIMRQILAGLSEAHSQEVVHRDLKPPNIMIDAEGGIRIMDFGIARTADSHTITGTSEMMGTPDYISPEQVKGETADAQSDLYSFGVILYELLTGETPFKGDTPISKIVSRIQTAPKPPRELNPDIPKYLERIILKCLEVDQEFRYQTAAEILEDLELEQVDRSRGRKIRKAIARQSHWIAVACIVAAVGVAGYIYQRMQPIAEGADNAPVTTIAILPFENVSGAEVLDWMQEGIPEMLITDVSQMSAIRPITAQHIQQVLEEIGKGGGADVDEETAKVVAELTGADHALYGRFVRSGEEVRLDLDLRDSETGLPTPFKIQGSEADLFGLVDQVTDEVAAILNVDEESLPINELTTASVEAYRAYQQGLSELARGENGAAIPRFEEAIELDGEFVMAYAKLADTLFLMGNTSEARKAIHLAQQKSQAVRLPRTERFEIHAIAARIADDPQTAVNAYRQLAKLLPDDPMTLLSLSRALETLGDLDAAASAYRDVLELSPQHGAALLGLGRALVIGGRSEEAIPVLEDALAANAFGDDHETLGMIYSILGVAQRHLGEYEPAIRELERSLEHRREANDSRGVATTLANLAEVYTYLGKNDQARSLLEEGLEISRSSGDSTMESFVQVNLGFIEQRSGNLTGALQQYSDSLEIEWERGDHQELAERLNLIGHVYSKLGRFADAMVYLEQSKTHVEIASASKRRADNLLFIGLIQKAKGQHEDAVRSLLNALYIFQDDEDRQRVAEVWNELAMLYAAQGDFDEAEAAIASGLAIAEELRMPTGAAYSHLLRADLLASLSRTDAAKRELEAARAELNGVNSHDLAPLENLVASRIERASGDLASAGRYANAALRFAEQSGHLELRLRAAVAVAHARALEHPTESAAMLVAISDEAARKRLRPIQVEAEISLAELQIAGGSLAEVADRIERMLELAQEIGNPALLERANDLRARLMDASTEPAATGEQG